MVSNDSRTTRKARQILGDNTVSVAIPVSSLDADGTSSETPTKGIFKLLFNRGSFVPQDPSGKVLAFTNAGVALMSTKQSNAGMPDALLARTASAPTIDAQDEDGLIVDLDGAKYRVGLIHQGSMTAAIDRTAARVGEAAATETEPELLESDRNHDSGQDMSDVIEIDDPEPDAPLATEQGRMDAPRAAAKDWVKSFEQSLRTDDPFASTTPIETRSRPTMQCQRLLRDHHVYISVPAKAVPREGTDDPKGDFLVAFTDRGLMLFKPTRGNKALPRDVIGPVDGNPVTFVPADYNSRDGGELLLGHRSYIVPRAYVDSLMAHLEEHPE